MKCGRKIIKKLIGEEGGRYKTETQCLLEPQMGLTEIAIISKLLVGSCFQDNES